MNPCLLLSQIVGESIRPLLLLELFYSRIAFTEVGS